jgi:hypothetical protein
MQSKSLVGLRAVDIAKLLAVDDSFVITSYNRPLAIVIQSEYKSKREFFAVMQKIAEELFDE